MSEIETIAKWGLGLENSEERDALATVWQEDCSNGRAWGGRGHGGRGVRNTSGQTKDVSLDNVSISFDGKELLENVSLTFIQKHRYGLIGENGSGKSTLLRRIAKGSIPGFPQHFNIVYIQQELPTVPNVLSYHYILSGQSTEDQIAALKAEEEELEAVLEHCTNNGNEELLIHATERLCLIADEIESFENGTKSSLDITTSTTAELLAQLPAATVNVLKGLNLTKKLKMNLDMLSGGWRMRCTLARALLGVRSDDILLLDEVTNHLDTAAIEWLEQHISSLSCIVLAVSHDREFLDNIATDIIEFKDKRLIYFSGCYSEWETHCQELTRFHEARLDAQSRQEEHIKRSIKNAKAAGNDKMAKSKVKKLERASMHQRADGKKFKLFSLRKIGEDFLRFPDRIEAIRSSPSLRFRFPEPDLTALRVSGKEIPLLSLDNCDISWSNSISPDATEKILSAVTMQLLANTKIALIGPNGHGKSSLMASIVTAAKGMVQARNDPTPSKRDKKKGGGISLFGSRSISSASSSSSSVSTSTSTSSTSSNSISSSSSSSIEANKYSDPNVIVTGNSHLRSNNLRIGVVSQNHIDALGASLTKTAVEYVVERYFTETESTMSEIDARTHLGMFALGGAALQQIGSLSGGQKARLCFAAASVHNPHILLLDEPTNHLSMSAIDALAIACRDFTGGIVVASHNRYFVGIACTETALVEKGSVSIQDI